MTSGYAGGNLISLGDIPVGRCVGNNQYFLTRLDFGLSPAEFGLWFGILILIVVEMGLITPPVGLNLFIINKMAAGTKLGQTYLGVLPFIISDLVRVAVLVAFPAISLLLVRLLV